jgi:hypothetical protein
LATRCWSRFGQLREMATGRRAVGKTAAAQFTLLGEFLCWRRPAVRRSGYAMERIEQHGSARSGNIVWKRTPLGVIDVQNTPSLRFLAPVGQGGDVLVCLEALAFERI